MVRVVDDSAYRNSDANHSKMIQMCKVCVLAYSGLGTNRLDY